MYPRVPPATRALILTNVGVFLLQLLDWNLMVGLFALWPTSSQLFHGWQLITYAFLHGNLPHIFLNMFALFMFGRGLELYWGGRRFLIYYFVCVLSAAVTQLLVEGAAGGNEPVLGASGGVFGVLLAFAWYFPNQRLIVLPIPIPVPAWLFVRGAVHPLLADAPPLQFVKPHRPPQRPARIAQQRVTETAAAEDAPVGEREPVAAAFDQGVAHADVQRTGGVTAEGRAALELGVRHQEVVGEVRMHGMAVCVGCLTCR